MNFWEAYQKMKQGHKIARKWDKHYIYTNREILRFDDRYGIVDNNTCVANISAVELEAINWEVVNPNFLIYWKEEYRDLNGDMFLKSEV